MVSRNCWWDLGFGLYHQPPRRAPTLRAGDYTQQQLFSCFFEVVSNRPPPPPRLGSASSAGGARISEAAVVVNITSTQTGMVTLRPSSSSSWHSVDELWLDGCRQED